MLRRRLASLVSLGALSLLGACASGAEDDGFGVLSGAYGGPSDGSTGGTEGESEDEDGSGGGSASTTTGSQPPPSDEGSSDDGGDPLCCEPRAEAGCGSPTTESCVCASQPSCCQNVWGQGCVDLAIACGDPFCAGEPGEGSSTGDPVEPPDPPPEPPPEEPPPEEPEVPWPSCPCLSGPGIDNFCHYGPSYPGCPMTAPGGYCDPNGDAAFDEGDWDQGWYDWHDQCT